MKSKKVTIKYTENIVDSPITDVLVGAFNRYAKEVITDRAIPDARDGLKPVQRRIIYGMFKSGQVHEKTTVKCATIVGNIMGHYHPHGDSSIYEALVHMSQIWKMEAPLIDFQGNNGSIDDDPAAANRYTEARLSKLSEYLVRDIDKDVVRMVPTFDDKFLEPTVLPARYPNLLVNGTSGIAVGSSTNIPPHNLGEIVDATIYRLKHKKATLDDLLTFVKGPDFPTGGILDDKEKIHQIYETGHGDLYLYCKVDVDEGENALVISEIPYGVCKKDLVASLVKRKETDNLDNIDEIIDESAKDDVKIVITLKDNASPYDILNYLMSKKALRSTISCNFLALDRGHPKCMSLMEMIDAFIDHQRNVSTKAFKYDLQTDLDRLEIVEGYIKCYSILNEVIEKIKKCKGKEGVKDMLKADYSFSERQAEAIAMMPLYRLSSTDIVALNEENSSLKLDIDRINQILADPDKLDNTIVKTLTEVRKDFAINRKTEIKDEKLTFDDVDPTKLIAKEDIMVAITSDGYAKRTSIKSYQASLKANKDENDPLNLPKIKLGDHLVFCSKVDTHSGILFFTSLGNYGYVICHALKENKWKEEGTHLNNIVKLSSNEKVVKAFKIDEFKDGLNVIILTKDNKIKRTPLKEFAQTAITKKPLKACKLLNKDKDAVVDVAITSGNSDVIVIDELGRCSRFNENEIPEVSQAAVGVKAIASTIDNTPLSSLVSLTSSEVSLLLVLSSKRAARLISSNKIPTTSRLGAKNSLVKILKRNPFKIISVEKISKNRNEPTYVSLITPDTTYAMDINALTNVDLNSEMRENVPIDSKREITGINYPGDTIDENTLVEQPIEIKKESTKANPDSGYAQLSLFDMFEKIDK